MGSLMKRAFLHFVVLLHRVISSVPMSSRGADRAPLILPSSPTVDAVALEERASALAKRSLKKVAKIAGLRLAIRMMDLTTLEGKDTPGKVRAL